MMNHNILLVDDDPAMIQFMGRILADSGNLQFANGGEDAMRLVRESAPDLMLLDAMMPGMNGFQVFDALKAEPQLAEVPVIFVTGQSGAMCEAAGFEMGAADFIAKPVSPPVVLARVQAQLRRKREIDLLRHKATHDGLTQVANRTLFNQSIEHAWLQARRASEPLALLLIDVDHFKLYNHHYGLSQGDACLQHLAQSLVCAGLHSGDLVARCGGAEFVMLLPQTERGGAERVAHRVLDLVDALAIPHRSSLTAGHVTVSVGVACYDEASACWSKPCGGADPGATIDRGYATAGNLLLAADRALSCAKLAGRAQARLLDLADLEEPQRARAVAPWTRVRRDAAWN